MVESVNIRLAVGQHDHIAPLRSGRVTSPRIKLEFVDIEPLPKAFRQFVNKDDLDVAELAVVTHILAHHFGVSVKGVAIPLWSRLPHTNLVCPADSDLAGPADLAGRTIGVRSYAQTSGMWVRGVLATEYAIDLSSIMWGTMEDAHLPDYEDPSNCTRYSSPPALRDRMMAGQFSAIMGERIVDPANVRSVIPDAEKTAHEWMDRTGIRPINHILAVRNAIADRHPWLPQELFAMFSQAREVAIADGADAPPPYGLEQNRQSLETAMRFSEDQGITPVFYEIDELFHPL